MALTHRRLTDKAKPWVQAALKRYAGSEPITWDVAVYLLPDPTSPTEEDNRYVLIPTLIVYLEIVHNKRPIYICVPTTAAGADKETVQNLVRDSIPKLYATRDGLDFEAAKAKELDSTEEVA